MYYHMIKCLYIRIGFIFFSLFLLINSYGQDTINVQQYMDKYNQSGWGDGYEYALRMKELSDLALKENNIEIYEACLLSKNVAFYELEDFDAFSKSVLECEEISTNNKSISDGFRSAILSDKALVEKIKGNHQAANDITLKAIELEKAGVKDSMRLATFYKNLIINSLNLSDINRAMEYAQKALSMYDGKNLSMYIHADTYHKYGMVFYDANKFEEAVSSLVMSQEIIESYLSNIIELNLDELDSYRLAIDNCHKLAFCALRLNDLKKMRYWIDRSIKYQQRIDFRKYRTNELLGLYYLKNNKFEKAKLNLEKSLDMAIEKYGSDRQYPVIPRMYLNLAKYYSNVDSVELCHKALQKGLIRIDQSTEDSFLSNPSSTSILNSDMSFKLLEFKAEYADSIYRSTNNEKYYQVAMNSYLSLLEHIDVMRNRSLSRGSKKYALDVNVGVVSKALDLVYDHYAKSKSQDELNVVFKILLQSKAKILYDRLKYKQTLDQSIVPKKLTAEEERLRMSINLKDKSIKSINVTNQIDSNRLQVLRQEKFELDEKYNIIDQKIREYDEDFKVDRTSFLSDSDLAELMKTLDEKSAIIEYYLSEDYLYSFIITRNDRLCYRYELNSIQDKLSLFNKALNSNPKVSEIDYLDNQFSYSEFSQFLLPIDELKSLGVSKVMLIPDGHLCDLPFEALLDDVGNFMIETFEFNYFYSFEQLYESVFNSEKGNGDILGLLPQFDALNDTNGYCNSKMGELTFAEKEIEFITKEYDGRFLMGPNASIDNFEREIKDVSIIHLATHASVNKLDPMLSEICLSDGSLTNFDLINMDINPDLVVLAACNTADGDIQKGEGVISLSRGFFQAGVKSLVSSLWTIDDYSSSEIIKDMYSQLMKGASKSESLRLSKLNYLNEADKLRSHPYYWAGLVQIGNDQPVVSNGNFAYMRYLLILVSIFALFLMVQAIRRT